MEVAAAEQAYQKYSDAAFLEQIGLRGLAPRLAEFWPAGGPVWDGLAAYPTPSGEDGVILVEGKGYARPNHPLTPGQPSTPAADMWGARTGTRAGVRGTGPWRRRDSA